MSKIFTPEMRMLLSIAGIGGIGLMTFLGIYLSKVRGSFAPYRKATIFYLLVCMLIFALIGFSGYKSVFINPYANLIMYQAIFLFLGFLHLYYMPKKLKWADGNKSFWFEVLFTVVIAAFGFIGFLLVFTWMNSTGYQYYMASSVSFFVIGYFIYNTFLKAINIPVKVYKKWYYPVHDEVEDPDENKMKNMLVISFEFQKKHTDKYFTNFRAKAPSDMEFGQLFYYFINDYNERHPKENIQFVNEQGQPYGWIFYRKPRWYTIGTKHIEPDYTFFTNHIKENDVIVCSRV